MTETWVGTVHRVGTGLVNGNDMRNATCIPALMVIKRSDGPNGFEKVLHAKGLAIPTESLETNTLRHVKGESMV